MDIEKLIDKLFNTAIQKPNSIQVSFEGMDNTRELFETFITIFTEGMKIHYGNNGHVDLDSLSHKDFELMKNYFASIGLQLNYHRFHVQQIENMENRGTCKQYISVVYDYTKITDEELKNSYPDTPSSDMLINYKNVKTNSLGDYKFQIRVKDNIYIVYFSIL